MKTALSHPKNMEQRNAAVSHQKTRGKKLKNMHLSFNTTKTKCYLCFNENIEIASCKGDNLLNKRSELNNKCRL